MPSTAALILAAGQSSRLGQPKQLVQLKEHHGQTLLRHIVSLAFSTGAHPVLVVIPPQLAEACHQTLQGLPAHLLPNPHAAEGMGSSLRLGMAALTDYGPDAERLLLLVCDQPRLRPEHLTALLHAEGPVAAAHYNQMCGVPAVFARSHFARLASVTGDQGARSLLQSPTVTRVPMPEAAIDLDTPQDLATLQRGP